MGRAIVGDVVQRGQEPQNCIASGSTDRARAASTSRSAAWCSPSALMMRAAPVAFRLGLAGDSATMFSRSGRRA